MSRRHSTQSEHACCCCCPRPNVNKICWRQTKCSTARSPRRGGMYAAEELGSICICSAVSHACMTFKVGSHDCGGQRPSFASPSPRLQKSPALAHQELAPSTRLAVPKGQAVPVASAVLVLRPELEAPKSIDRVVAAAAFMKFIADQDILSTWSDFPLFFALLFSSFADSERTLKERKNE